MILRRYYDKETGLKRPKPSLNYYELTYNQLKTAAKEQGINSQGFNQKQLIQALREGR